MMGWWRPYFFFDPHGVQLLAPALVLTGPASYFLGAVMVAALCFADVDDPRNTDNAWVETTVLHFHCNEEQTRDLVPSASEGEGTEGRAGAAKAIKDVTQKTVGVLPATPAEERTVIEQLLRKFSLQEPCSVFLISMNHL